MGSTVESTLLNVPAKDRERLLSDLLRGVSRSFYLTLRILPAGLRIPVGVAYLLGRAADTIADTRLLPPSQRLAQLIKFRGQIEGEANEPSVRQIGQALTDKQDLPQERALLESLPQVFSVLDSLVEPDRSLIRSVVVTLTRGMEEDLTTFPAEDSGQIAALANSAALDRYTYMVAGCVGEFWTRIMMEHCPDLKDWNGEHMQGVGVRFGKALQLTNVLRDIPRDLRNGRCYLPTDELLEAGLNPGDLLNSIAGEKARPVLVSWIETALDHFDEAERYLLVLPRRCVRLRLAVLWPMLLGLATLALLAKNRDWLDPAKPSKVKRSWVYWMMARSWAAVMSDTIIKAWVRTLRRRVESAL